MALRFYSEHKSYSDGLTWKIEIYDSTFAGDDTEFYVQGGARLSYRADGDGAHAPILASTLEFDMQIQNSTHEALITDMAGSKEGRFTVVLYKESVFNWAGVINAQDIEFEDMDYPYTFRITAVDGLALLKNYEYRQEGTDTNKWDLRYTGQDKLIEIIDTCIKKLPHIATHFTGASKFYVTAVNWYTEEHEDPITDDYDPLYYTELDNRAFVQGQSTGNAKFPSCYDVISQILRLFHARIALFDGYFLLEQFEHRVFTIGSSANFSRYYPYTLTTPAANTDLTASQDVGLTTDIPKLRGGTYSFLPPLRSVRVTQTVNGLQNLLEGAYFDSDVTSFSAGTVSGDGLNTFVRFTANVAWTISDIGLIAAGSFLYLRFHLTILIDGLYAQQDLTVSQNGTVTAGVQSWSGSTEYIDILVPEIASGDSELTGSDSFDLMFKTDSTFSSGSMTVEWDFVEMLTYTPSAPNSGSAGVVDPANYDIDWSLNDVYAVILNNPKKVKISGLTPATAYPKAVTYEVIGDDENTEVEEVNTILGGLASLVTNQWGALLFFDSPDYVYAGDWGARTGTRNRPIVQLLAQRLLASRYFPRKILRGTVAGNTFIVQDPIEERSEVYFLKTGTYSTEKDEMSGEWVKLAYTEAEFTYAPVEYDTGQYDPTTPGGAAGTGGSSGGTNTGGGGTTPPAGGGGNGIYGGSGTVADGTIATLADDFEFSGGDTSSLTITTGTATGGQIFSDFSGASIIYRDAGNNTVTASAGGVAITTGGSAGDKLLVTGLADIEYSGTDPALTVLNTTSNTATVQDVLRLQANSSGVAGVGFGSAILFQQESSTTDDQDAVRLAAVWTTATHATRGARFVIFTSISGVMTEIARFQGNSVPNMTIGGGSTAYLNNGISTGTTFSVGSSANLLNLGGSSGTTVLGGSDGIVIIRRNTATANAAIPIHIIANTSGTAANGLGPQFLFQSETSTTPDQDIGAIQAQWTDVTHATRASKLVFQSVYGATLAELFTLAWTTATANTASITTTNSNTNVGVAIVPKGTGALTAAIPEGTAAGGNARGSRAVDLQTDRNAATQVASGANSFVGGGRRNTASGSYSIAIGGASTASNSGAVALGGNGSTGATASGSGSFAMGAASVASGDNSFAVQAGTASAENAVSFGGATAAFRNQFAMSAFAFVKYSQKTITGLAATELFLDNGNTERITIAASTGLQFNIIVSAVVSIPGGGTVVAGDIYCASFNGVIANKGGTTALLGTVDADMAAKADANMADVVFTVSADDANDALKIEYTAGAGSTGSTQTIVNVSIRMFRF